MSDFKLESTSVDSVQLLTFNHRADGNVFDELSLQSLKACLDQAASRSDIKTLIIVSGKADHFVYGADIKLIQSFKSAREATEGAQAMQAIFNQLAGLSATTICAINGACMGGGTEMALACDFRIMSDDPKTVMALPEIQLGLLPGAGGTQRLPRLVGIQAGLDMILTGKPMDARKASKIGLADGVCHKNQLIDFAIQFSKTAKRKPRIKSTMEKLLEGNPIGRNIMKKKALQMIEKNTKGFYPAPFKALDAVFRGIETSLDKGLLIEATAFGELLETREARSLIHLFHATTHAKKNRFAEAEKSEFGGKFKEIKEIGVIGAGFMGSGVTNVCADKGYRVRLTDPSEDSISKAYSSASKYFQGAVKRKKIKPFEKDIKLNHISATTSTGGQASADIIIEAVFENTELKQSILERCEAKAHKHQIFASNTSALPIASIAAKSKFPDRVLGMHFFSPVEKMPLLEVIITDKTAHWAASQAIRVGQKLGKQVIVVKDSPGFYTTRALAMFLNEAAILLEEGNDVKKIDSALTGFGFPVGPVTLIDEVGIDVSAHVIDTMKKSFPETMQVPKYLSRVLDTGALGRKNGKGFFNYADGKKGEPNRSIVSLMLGLTTQELSREKIVDRCLLLFVNESVKCLDEGVLDTAIDGDIGAVFGLGFPPFWGGPFRYIDHVGVDSIVAKLNELAATYGPRFKPAKGLMDRVSTKELFFPNEA